MKRMALAGIAAGCFLLFMVARSGTAQTPAGTPAEPGAGRCAALRTFSWQGLAVEEARLVPAGKPEGAAADAAPLPEHCVFRATLDKRTGAAGQQLGIGMDIRLPTAWNGRFVFEGGGGLDGVLHASYGALGGGVDPPALARGFAVASTDGGHRGSSNIDPKFALDQQARLDYAYGAVDRTTLVAKALLVQFYGRPAAHAYFLGCSNGGRQAMMATQRLPLMFDGVVAGDPSFRLTRTNIAEAWNEIVLARAAPRNAQGRPVLSRVLSEADLQRVADAVLKECDGKDGLVDGMINDYKACRFDPAVLACKGDHAAGCLAPAQVTALQAIMAGPHDSAGHALYASFPYDAGIAEPAFHRMHFGSATNGDLDAADATLGFDSLRYLALTPADPGFDPMRFDFDRDPARTAESAKFVDADAVSLQSFAAHGKLILYHGLSDQGLSPRDTADWYQRMQAANGGDVHGWARLFLVPGMLHCAGGPATDRFDMLAAIQDWVEAGHAPDRIIARGKAFLGVTRPLCPYPQVARYKGGDPASEASFACSE